MEYICHFAPLIHYMRLMSEDTTCEECSIELQVKNALKVYVIEQEMRESSTQSLGFFYGIDL